jgi:hypothetical protein
MDFLPRTEAPSPPAFWTRNDGAAGLQAITLALKKFKAKHEHLVSLYLWSQSEIQISDYYLKLSLYFH